MDTLKLIPHVSFSETVFRTAERLNVHALMDAPSFRRTRTTFSPFQLQMLEQAFTKTQYPDAVVRQQLATYMQLPESKIQVCSSK